MTLYGEMETVQTQLRGAPNITLNADFPLKFAEIQVAISSALEQKIGRAFGGGAATPTPRVVYAGGTSSLLLPVPARTITGVTRLGTYDGAVYIGGMALSAGYWIADPVDRYGNILGIRLANGEYWGLPDYGGRPTQPVLITGTWADQNDETEIPADITAAANYLIAERYKALSASPAGFVGPDGTTIPIRNPWNAEEVKAVIEKYRAVATLAF